MDPSTLLQKRESEWLDFKQEFHDNNASLLHDMLCLANSYAESDRYLVFGVSDVGAVVGVAGDPNRKANANLQDFLRQANLNRILTCVIETHCVGVLEVDVLRIKNRPDKPFFLTKDYSYRDQRVRNGVVYTRLSDTNIPKDSSAPDDHVELMWRERFGLGLSPLQRLERLLNEPERWRKGGDEYMYCEQFPEFTVVDGETAVENFSEPWTQRFPDKHARSFEVQLRYHATVLDTVIFVACDGERYRVPMPAPRPSQDGTMRYVISTSSVGWKLAQIYRQYNPLDSAYPLIDIEFVP